MTGYGPDAAATSAAASGSDRFQFATHSPGPEWTPAALSALTSGVTLLAEV
jgi:hypothetical protein